MWTHGTNRFYGGGTGRGGYRHRVNCPNEEREKGDGTSSDEDGKGDQLEADSGDECCSDRRCTTWFDLRNWFGFLSQDLPYADFKACFTDIAHGGVGLYEKLIVLGGKTLETFAELHFYELYASAAQPYVPQELLDLIPSETVRILWTQKRVESTTSSHALYVFGRSYLATAQGLSTRLAVAKYVKGCIGFSCQSRDSENIYKWMPAVTEHISWAQRVRTEVDEHANALLQDLQTYLGYKEDRLLPRIKEVLKGRHVPQRSDTPTGKELVRLYAADYFNILAQESGVERRNQAAWADGELQTFMTSPAVPLFAVVCMSLQPYLMYTDSRGLPPLELFESTFFSLVASCWILSTEEKVKIWMPALIQRLRQVQLLARLSTLEGTAYSRATRRRKLAAHPVELSQFAGANNEALSCFGLWNIDPGRFPLSRPGVRPQRNSTSPTRFPGAVGGISSPETPGDAAKRTLSCCDNILAAAAAAVDPAAARRSSTPVAVLPPPPDRSLLIVEPGETTENVSQLQRLTLKPFGRVVFPLPGRRESRRTRPQQNPTIGSACCVWNISAPSASPCAAAAGAPDVGFSPAPDGGTISSAQEGCCGWPSNKPEHSPPSGTSPRRSRSRRLKIWYTPEDGRMYAREGLPQMAAAGSQVAEPAGEPGGRARAAATGEEHPRRASWAVGAPVEVDLDDRQVLLRAPTPEAQDSSKRNWTSVASPARTQQKSEELQAKGVSEREHLQPVCLHGKIPPQGSSVPPMYYTEVPLREQQMLAGGQQPIAARQPSPESQLLQQQRFQLELQRLQMQQLSMQQQLQWQLQWQLQHQSPVSAHPPCAATRTGSRANFPLFKGHPGSSKEIGFPSPPASLKKDSSRQDFGASAPLLPLNSVDVLVYSQRPSLQARARLPTPMLLPPVPSKWFQLRPPPEDLLKYPSNEIENLPPDVLRLEHTKTAASRQNATEVSPSLFGCGERDTASSDSTVRKLLQVRHFSSGTPSKRQSFFRRPSYPSVVVNQHIASAYTGRDV